MKSSIVFLISFLFHTGIYAEPDSTTLYLMNQNVTLFGFGLYRMEERIENYKSPYGVRGSISVSFDWSLNRIIIESLVAWKPGERKLTAIEATKENCAAEVKAIRRAGGVDTRTGKPYIRYSLFSMDFAAVDYFQRKGEPENLHKKIDNIIKIKVHVLEKDKSISCEVFLVSEEILFGEIKRK